MVAQVIEVDAGGAGAAAKSGVSKAHVHRQSRTGTQNTRSGSMRRAQNTRKAIRERQINISQSTEREDVIETLQDKEESSDKDFHLIKRVRAIRASWIIAAFIFPFYWVQLAFGVVQLAGFGGEYLGEQFLWGIGAIFIPGQTIFAAGLIVTILLGCGSMLFAALMYTFQGVSWWRGPSLLGFIIFTVLCFLPLLNIFPWVIGWMFTVIYAQK